MLPPLMILEKGAFGVATFCRSEAFPEFFQGLLIVPDAERHGVQAFTMQLDGATFRVASQFDLIRTDDKLFRPETVVQGADGAIYVFDRAATDDGAPAAATPAKVLRLNWAGHGDVPARPLLSPDRLAIVTSAGNEELCKLLENTDPQVRQATVCKIIAAAGTDGGERASLRERLAALLKNERLPVPIRASVILAATPHADKAIRQELCRLIEHENAEIVRLAANALGESPPTDPEELAEVGDHVKGAYGRVSHAASQRAIQFALARLAVAGIADAAEWGFEATSVTHGPKMSRYVFDGHVRALEMVPGAAKELMLGNLDVAINLDVTEPTERQRLKEFVTLTAEAMRTRELADFLDALLRGDDDLFVKIEAPLEARLIACYQNVLVDPPINADAVIEWLEKHPGGPVEVEIAALETLANVGTTKKEAFDKLAERLLADPAAAATIAQRLISGHLNRSLLPRVRAAIAPLAAKEKAGEAAKLLAELDKVERRAP